MANISVSRYLIKNIRIIIFAHFVLYLFTFSNHNLKRILCDFVIIFGQIIVLNQYHTYDDPIPKIAHVKTKSKHWKLWENYSNLVF